MDAPKHDKELEPLCNQLEEYCKTNKLELMSADELLWEIRDWDDGHPDKARHVKWLSGFIQRWEGAELAIADIEDAQLRLRFFCNIPKATPKAD